MHDKTKQIYHIIIYNLVKICYYINNKTRKMIFTVLRCASLVHNLKKIYKNLELI